MKNSRNLFLAGGGGQEDSILLDRLFVSSLSEEGLVGYIPNAMDSRPYEECLAWFKSVFLPLDLKSFAMMTELEKVNQENLSGLYIGGGNTSKLVREARKSGFDRFLKDIAYFGLPIYGGSAGAIILGKTISTAPESIELEEDCRDGVDVLDGFSVCCHFEMETSLSEVSRLSKTEKILALSEKAGIHLSGNNLKSIGFDPVRIYCRGEEISIVPGEARNINDFA